MTESYKRYIRNRYKHNRITRSDYESEHEYNIGTNELNDRER